MGTRTYPGGMRIQIETEDEDRSRSIRYGLPTAVFPPDVVSESFSIIQVLANAVEKQLSQTRATEAEITFGLKLSASGEFCISNTPNKGNYLVKLKWDRDEASNLD